MAKMAAVNRSEYPEGSLIMEEKTDMIDQPERTKVTYTFYLETTVLEIYILHFFRSNALLFMVLNSFLEFITHPHVKLLTFFTLGCVVNNVKSENGKFIVLPKCVN